MLAGVAVGDRRHDLAARYLEAGLDVLQRARPRARSGSTCSSIAHASSSNRAAGRRRPSPPSGARIRRTSTTPRILALVVLGLVRARRGDPGTWPPLDEAWALAEPTGELPRLGPVARRGPRPRGSTATATRVAAATEAHLERVAERASGCWFAGELACWRRRAGHRARTAAAGAAEPYALQLAGDWARARRALARARLSVRGRARAGGRRRGGAAPACAGGAAAARTRGRRRRSSRGGCGSAVRAACRAGRAPATRENPAGLTPRELEVLGCSSPRAARTRRSRSGSSLSERTVDHHVSAILRKLQVGTRGDAAAAAARLGLAAQDR